MVQVLPEVDATEGVGMLGRVESSLIACWANFIPSSELPPVSAKQSRRRASSRVRLAIACGRGLSIKNRLECPSGLPITGVYVTGPLMNGRDGTEASSRPSRENC